MPIYTLQDAQGKVYRVEGPAGISERDLIEYVNRQIESTQAPAASPREETSAFKQFAKTMGLEAAPVAGGIAGFGAAAQAALPLAAMAGPAAPIVEIGAGLLGGIAGSMGAGKVQQEIIKRMPETAKTLGIDEESMAKGREEAPWATESAEILSQLIAFKPGLKAFKSTKDLADDLAQEIWQARKYAAVNAAIGATTTAGMQGLSGQPLDVQSIAENAALGAILQNPRKYGEVLERAGRRLIPGGRAAPTVTPPPGTEAEVQPERRALKDITEQQRLPFGGEQFEMDLGPVPKEVAEEYPELFVEKPVLDKKGKPTGKVTYEFKRPETEVSPDQMALDFEREQPPVPAARPEVPEVPLEEPSGQMGLDFNRRPPQVAAEQLELPLPGQQEMFPGQLPQAEVSPETPSVYEPNNKFQRPLDFSQIQEQPELPLTLPPVVRPGEQPDLFAMGEPLPPRAEPAVEVAQPEAAPGTEVSPDQMAFDLPGTPVKQLSPRDQIMRAFQISRIHTNKELRSATGLSFKDYLAEINKLKNEGIIKQNKEDNTWELVPPPKKAITEQQQLFELPPVEEPAKVPQVKAEAPAAEVPQGEQLGFDFGKKEAARERRLREKAATPDTGPSAEGVGVPRELGTPPAAGVGDVGAAGVERTVPSTKRVDAGEAPLGGALETTAEAKPDRISQRIIQSGAGSDFVRGLYEPNPIEATRDNFNDLDTVTPKQIEQARNYIKNISQNLLRQQFGDEITLYRGLKGTEDKTPVLSYSLDKRTAEHFANKQGIRSGKIEEIKVPVSEVLSYSEAIGKGTFDEAEVLIPKTARTKYLSESTKPPTAKPVEKSALEKPYVSETAETAQPGETLRRLVSTDQLPLNKVGAGLARYFEAPPRETLPSITLPREEYVPSPPTRSARAVAAIEEGNLGKALYHLTEEAGGDIKGGVTPLPHGQPSPLRDLAQALFNTFERTDDRSAMIAAEQKRYARELGRPLSEAEKDSIADLINSDIDLTKYDFTDVDGNLTDAGKIAQNFKPQYERLINFPKGTKFDRTGQFVSTKGKELPLGSFGGARVVVEKPGLRGADKDTIGRIKAENKYAEYDPRSNTFYFTRDGLNDRIILHEMSHAATVKVLKQYEVDPSQLTTRQREGVEQMKRLYDAAKVEFDGKHEEALKNIYEFASHAATDEAFQRDLATLRAPEGTPKDRFKLRTMWDQFTLALAKMFKLDKYAQTYEKKLSTRTAAAAEGDNALLLASQALKDILAVPKKGIDVPALAAKKVKEEEVKTIKEIQDRLPGKEGRAMPATGNKRSLLRSVWESVSTPKGREQLITNVQNAARPAKKRQDDLRNSGIQNYLYDTMTAAGTIGEERVMRMGGLTQKLNSAVETLMNKAGIDLDQFLKDFHLFALARDEADYRKAKFAVNAPLEAAGAKERDEILKDLGKGVDIATARRYRDRLDQLVRPKDQGGMLDPMGDSALREKVGPKPMSTDINSPLYNVAGPYTQKQLEMIRQFHNDQMKLYKPEIDAVFDALKDIRAKTIEYNKEAGYHPPQLDGIIEFYRRPNYVPYKGDPNLKDANAMFDINGPRTSGNLSQLQDKAEGRNTDSENPLLQILSDAAKAAGRVGLRDVSEETVRLIDAGHIVGKKIADVPFNERFMGLVNKEDIEGADRIFRHTPDGRVEVYKISDPEMAQAIKGFIGNEGSFWKVMNQITSAIGRQHTLYNPGFAPYDYVRNMVTAATTVGGDISPAQGAKYAAALTSKLLDGGLFKAMRYAKLYENGDMAGIDALKAKEGGKGFYNTLDDWRKAGGQASFRTIFNTRTIGEELAKEVGKSGNLRTLDQVKKLFRVWSDTFEFAGRAAGYDVVLPEVLARYKAEGRDIKSPEVLKLAKLEAAQYVKNIFNFNEVGRYGREAGSVFMFLRPSLTSAARFYDTFAPAMQSAESAVRELPKSITDVDTVYTNMLKQTSGKLDAAQKAALRQQAEAQVAKNLDTFQKDFMRRKQNAKLMALALSAMGYGIYNVARLMSDTDEQGRNKIETDNMEIWSRNIRIPAMGLLGKDNDYFQIPWGWGFGSFGAFGAQLAGVINGESTPMEMVKNSIPIALQSFIPLPVPNYSPVEQPWTFALSTVTPSFARPFLEYVTNVDNFGREIYYNRMNQFGNPYTGGETLPEMYGKMSELLADHLGVVVEPRTLNFFVNSYLDGYGRLANTMTGVGMSAVGDRRFDPKYDLPLVGSFIGKSSSFDAREFADVRKDMEALGSRMDILKDRPEQYYDYLEKHPNAQLLVDAYRSQVNGELKKVQSMIKTVSGDPYMSSQDKRDMIKDLKLQRDFIMRGIIDTMKAYQEN